MLNEKSTIKLFCYTYHINAELDVDKKKHRRSTQTELIAIVGVA